MGILDFFSRFTDGSGSAKRPDGPAVKTVDFQEKANRAYCEEDGQIVLKYYETMCQTAGKGHVPTVSDLPCPPHRIHMALTRAAKDDGVPPHIRKIAMSALGSLVLFE